MSRYHSQGRPFHPPATGMAAGRALHSSVSCSRSILAPHCTKKVAASLLTFPWGKERNKCGCHQEIVGLISLIRQRVKFMLAATCSLSQQWSPQAERLLYLVVVFVCLGWGEPHCGSACLSPLVRDSVQNILSATSICTGQMKSFWSKWSGKESSEHLGDLARNLIRSFQQVWIMGLGRA